MIILWLLAAAAERSELLLSQLLQPTKHRGGISFGDISMTFLKLCMVISSIKKDTFKY